MESGRRNGWKSHSTGGIDGFPMDLELVGVFYFGETSAGKRPNASPKLMNNKLGTTTV